MGLLDDDDDLCVYCEINEEVEIVNVFVGVLYDFV